MKEFWEQSIEELESALGSSVNGITTEQVQKIRIRTGENVMTEGKKKSVIRVFLDQFCDLLVAILIIAAIISMLSGNTESTIVIFLVLILNAILGTVQHQKAQKSLDSLKELSSPCAKVMRNGVKTEVPAKDIVPGDLVLLEAGDMVVADGRVIHSYSLQVNESSLTGESTNVEKRENELPQNTPLADRVNMVFSGSLVTYGRAEILVTSTGMETEIGRIAGLMNAAKERKTPLQISLDQFSGRLAVMIMVICTIVFGLCMYRKMNLLESLLFAVALAVAAIPEALSSIVTIVQAMGTRKMAAENAIIKELKAVESLGCVSVICSDKTGTLTQNKMTIQEVYLENKVFLPEQIDLTSKLHRLFLLSAILNNDSSISEEKQIGDPTETALLDLYRKVLKNVHQAHRDWGLTEQEVRACSDRIEELPFDSDRKMMSTKYSIDGKEKILTKGAVDVLLQRCTNIWDEQGVRPITSMDRADINRQNMLFSQKGLRVLAFAFKDSTEQLTYDTENGLSFVGLVAMMDPPRIESAEAVKKARQAGIQPIMITGDHKLTAVAIAEKIGIFEQGDIAVTGTELDDMSKEELEEQITNISVYARVSPENKIRIVDAWQNQGKIVAMTGDGVNDAPALKKADIGIAMGITGTEVSKDAAAMILADENFMTIIKAVANGRNIYRNIRNAILFLLSGNMAAILAVLYTSLVGLPLPFAPVHLLFINLLTDSLPAIAIGMEPSDKGLLQMKPRDPKESILTTYFLLRIMLQGVLIGMSSMIAFYIGLQTNAALASTMAFATLTLARLFHGFNCRNSQSVCKLGLRSNPYSIYAFGGGVCLLAMVLCIPFLQRVFSVSALSISHTGWIVLLAFMPTLFIQVKRLITEWLGYRKAHIGG